MWALINFKAVIEKKCDIHTYGQKLKSDVVKGMLRNYEIYFSAKSRQYHHFYKLQNDLIA